MRTIREIVEEVFVLIQPTGLNAILDIFPWLHHFPNKQYTKLVENAATAKEVISKKIIERKVRLCNYVYCLPSNQSYNLLVHVTVSFCYSSANLGKCLGACRYTDVMAILSKLT